MVILPILVGRQLSVELTEQVGQECEALPGGDGEAGAVLAAAGAVDALQQGVDISPGLRYRQSGTILYPGITK